MFIIRLACATNASSTGDSSLNASAPDGTMRAKGDPASVQLAEVVERVKAVLGEEWEKTSEVRDGLGEPTPSTAQVRNALSDLARLGEVLRDPALDVPTSWVAL